MKIKRSSWHYRRYARWEVWKKRTNHRYQSRTTLDLCHYVRVVLFWYSLRWPFQRRLFGTELTPLLCLLGGIFLGALVISLYGLTHVSNWSKVAIIGGSVVGGILLVIALVFGIFYAFEEKQLHVVIRESDTFQITKSYIKAKKSRVCPILKVEE